MPEEKVARRAKQKLREGKRPTTAASEFVGEEMRHVESGKHRAKSRKQAIAIGLSKARRAGIPVPPPERGEAKEETREQAERDLARGQGRTP